MNSEKRKKEAKKLNLRQEDIEELDEEEALKLQELLAKKLGQKKKKEPNFSRSTSEIDPQSNSVSKGSKLEPNSDSGRVIVTSRCRRFRRVQRIPQVQEDETEDVS